MTEKHVNYDMRYLEQQKYIIIKAVTFYKR